MLISFSEINILSFILMPFYIKKNTHHNANTLAAGVVGEPYCKRRNLI